MEMTNFYNEFSALTQKIFQTAEIEKNFLDEQEKQILGAYCFGIINGYAIEKEMDAVIIQAVMIEILNKEFGYEPYVAAQFCDFLIQCTEEEFHPTIYAIIHRGLEAYYRLEEGKEGLVKKDLKEIIKVIKEYE